MNRLGGGQVSGSILSTYICTNAFLFHNHPLSYYCIGVDLEAQRN